MPTRPMKSRVGVHCVAFVTGGLFTRYNKGKGRWPATAWPCAQCRFDAAAIVYCEAGFNGRSDRLAENGMIAGYLHDIMRDESDHPRKGAQYAANCLKGLMSDYDLEMIVFAIKNHEAFREFDVVSNADYMLLSNALYDADKFRWGPDNFVYTLWDMAESMNIKPDFIIKNYDRAIEGIVRVRETFRTATGKRYGPDFIDKGLEIGRVLYKFCRCMHEQ